MNARTQTAKKAVGLKGAMGRNRCVCDHPAARLKCTPADARIDEFREQSVWCDPVLGLLRERKGHSRRPPTRPPPRAASLRNHRKLEPGNFFCAWWSAVGWFFFAPAAHFAEIAASAFFASLNSASLSHSQLFAADSIETNLLQKEYAMQMTLSCFFISRSPWPSAPFPFFSTTLFLNRQLHAVVSRIFKLVCVRLIFL